MKITLIFILTLISTKLWSQDISGILKLLGQTRSYSPDLSCSIDGSGNEHYQECARALCGDPALAPVGMAHGKNFHEYFDDNYMDLYQELPAIVKDLHEINRKEKTHFLNQLKAANSNTEKNLWGSLDEISKQKVAESYFTPFLIPDVDSTQEKLNHRLNFQFNFPDELPEEIKNEARLFAQKKKTEIENSLFEKINYELISLEDAISGLKEFEKNLFELLDNHKVKDPTFSPWYLSELEKLRGTNWDKNQSFDDLSQFTYLLDHYQQTLLKDLDPTHSSLNKPPKCGESCLKVLSDVFSTKEITHFEKAISDKLAGLNPESLLNRCQLSLLQMTLKKSDEEKIRALYPEIKKNLSDKVLSRMSEHSKKKFEEYLEHGLHLNFEHEVNADPKEWIGNLKKRNLAGAQSEDISPASILEKMLGLRSFENVLEFDLNPISCDGEAAIVWDSFLSSSMQKEYSINGAIPDKDNVQVSLFTCTHGEKGRGILSHEIGHALSSVIFEKNLSPHSEELYNKQRLCLKDPAVTTRLSSPWLNRPEDNLYSEEDMADFISFIATQDDPGLFTCALLDTDLEASKYVDLDLKNKYSFDSHSAPFLRMIREAILKKKNLPSSCQKIIEENPEVSRIKTCL